jgi:hypothetical protein
MGRARNVGSRYTVTLLNANLKLDDYGTSQRLAPLLKG